MVQEKISSVQVSMDINCEWVCVCVWVSGWKNEQPFSKKFKCVLYVSVCIYINANSLKYASKILNSSYWNNEWMNCAERGAAKSVCMCAFWAWMKKGAKNRKEKNGTQSKYVVHAHTKIVHYNTVHSMLIRQIFCAALDERRRCHLVLFCFPSLASGSWHFHMNIYSLIYLSGKSSFQLWILNAHWVKNEAFYML